MEEGNSSNPCHMLVNGKEASAAHASSSVHTSRRPLRCKSPPPPVKEKKIEVDFILPLKYPNANSLRGDDVFATERVTDVIICRHASRSQGRGQARPMLLPSTSACSAISCPQTACSPISYQAASNVNQVNRPCTPPQPGSPTWNVRPRSSGGSSRPVSVSTFVLRDQPRPTSSYGTRGGAPVPTPAPSKPSTIGSQLKITRAATPARVTHTVGRRNRLPHVQRSSNIDEVVSYFQADLTHPAPGKVILVPDESELDDEDVEICGVSSRQPSQGIASIPREWTIQPPSGVVDHLFETATSPLGNEKRPTSS